MACMGFAALVGGASGFGTALVATPLMLLAGVGITETVMVNLAVGLATRVAVLVRLRGIVDWKRVATLGGASLPGALLGILTVSYLPESWLKPAAGIVTVLCGVAMALPRPSEPTPPPPAANIAFGTIGGYFSTTTSLNGPPVVLLLSRANLPPMNFIADLAGYFVVINSLSLALLWGFSGESVPISWPLLAGCLAAGLVGNQIGMRIAERISASTFRVVVITLVLLSGTLAIVSA
ncbi:hypothetical protein ST47_g857 [Ascochyta rabiei]|uniref:Membrane transporter protein n=1 Tax=Didymella rabiei TaxID=5454 RepID=A0A163LPT5_DIDRA|nr:hypothetical protein ST47_g857 [Ascochyta rabiei]